MKKTEKNDSHVVQIAYGVHLYRRHVHANSFNGCSTLTAAGHVWRHESSEARLVSTWEQARRPDSADTNA